MATTRVTLTLGRDALAAAQRCAYGAGESLSVWLSRAAWDRAVGQSAALSAEQDRTHPEWSDWDEARTQDLLGESAA